MTSFCKLMGIQKINVSPGHQSSNGKCERMHKTLGEALRAITGSDSNWNLKLPMLEMSFQNAEIAGLGITPHELVFGTKPRTIADILVPESHENGPADDMHEYVQDLKLRLQTIHDITANNIAENQVKMKSAYDAKILRTKTYKQFDAVWLFDPSVRPNECAKLSKKWVGPFVIVSVLPKNNHILKHMKTGKILINAVHSDRLKTAFIKGYVPEKGQDCQTGQTVPDGTQKDAPQTDGAQTDVTQIAPVGLRATDGVNMPDADVNNKAPPDTTLSDPLGPCGSAPSGSNTAPSKSEKTDEPLTGVTDTINKPLPKPPPAAPTAATHGPHPTAAPPPTTATAQQAIMTNDNYRDAGPASTADNGRRAESGTTGARSPFGPRTSMTPMTPMIPMTSTDTETGRFYSVDKLL